MRLLHSLLNKLGLASDEGGTPPDSVFLLEDDERRHRWSLVVSKETFWTSPKTSAQAQEFLSANSYDAIFLDHDLHPEHYHADSTTMNAPVYDGTMAKCEP